METGDYVTIDLEDIQEEIDYWNSAVMCYVVGANPPIHVMEGFVRRIWRNMGVDKVVLRAKGVFLVRFTTMEKRDAVLKLNRPFFDSKPVVLKPWTQDMDFTKEDLRSVPIWVKLHRLGFMYWGERSLSKIVGKIGVLQKVDSATAKRDKLQFARVQVEVLVEQEFPDVIKFVNEKGMLVEVEVEYEWRPLVCSVCKIMGHDATKCKKGGNRRVWVPRQQVVPTAAAVVTPAVAVPDLTVVASVSTEVVAADGGFHTVVHSSRRRTQGAPIIPTGNPFHVLTEENTMDDGGRKDRVGDCDDGDRMGMQTGVSRRGDSPGNNG
ncbi:uncharacterized protein [Spinacia oleracea]|uniref:DUF4283 domain-containing protein n=1 Tax=Spinacia oleracea TaxID=3562 RepID=A0A9R0K028_SPIOL|nr:uncharacterized protein LOC110792201 [Spinacia oleracea]